MAKLSDIPVFWGDTLWIKNGGHVHGLQDDSNCYFADDKAILDSPDIPFYAKQAVRRKMRRIFELGGFLDCAVMFPGWKNFPN